MRECARNMRRSGAPWRPCTRAWASCCAATLTSSKVDFKNCRQFYTLYAVCAGPNSSASCRENEESEEEEEEEQEKEKEEEEVNESVAARSEHCSASIARGQRRT